MAASGSRRWRPDEDQDPASFVSAVVRLPVDRITHLLRTASSSYTTHSIPKRSGGRRKIQEPHDELKKVQSRLLPWMYSRLTWHPAATAGIPGGSTSRHARPHVGRLIVITLDIKSFFPSVNYGQVRAAFEANGIPAPLARALTILTTRRKALPQGAPTSQFVANLVLFGLDSRVAALARERGLRYTRYVDDLALSADWDCRELVPRFEKIVQSAGFTVAREKTRVQDRSDEQVVTGLAVNDTLRLSAEYKLATRTYIERVIADFDTQPAAARRLLQSVIQGHIGYARKIERAFAGEIQFLAAPIL